MQFYQTFGNFRILSYNDNIMSTFSIPGNVGFEHFDAFCFCFCLFVFCFCLPLSCLSFVLRILITLLVSSNSSSIELYYDRPLVLYRKYLTKSFVLV